MADLTTHLEAMYGDDWVAYKVVSGKPVIPNTIHNHFYPKQDPQPLFGWLHNS